MNDYNAIRELEILERKFALYVLGTIHTYGDSAHGSLYDYQSAEAFLRERPTPKRIELLVRTALEGKKGRTLCFGACNACGMHAPLSSSATDSVCVWGCPIPEKKEPTMAEQMQASLLVKCQFKHPSIVACIKANEHLTLCDDDGYCKYCGEQDEIAVSDEPTEDEINEPGALELSLTEDQPRFFFELATTNDENRAMKVSARPPEVLTGHRGGFALLCDEEDVADLFKFTHDWLRAGEHELPLLELHTNYANPSSIDIQAKDRRTISIQYDPEREVYVVYALTGDAVWKEMTNVPAIEAGKQPTGLSCPECQHGPCYPAGNMDDGYECGHCETVFIIPGRKHGQPPTPPTTSKVKDEGEPPREILMLQVPETLQVIYRIPEDSGEEDWGEDRRDVVALGRRKDSTTYEACVLNDAGKLVIASSIPYFAGMNED